MSPVLWPETLRWPAEVPSRSRPGVRYGLSGRGLSFGNCSLQFIGFRFTVPIGSNWKGGYFLFSGSRQVFETGTSKGFVEAEFLSLAFWSAGFSRKSPYLGRSSLTASCWPPPCTDLSRAGSWDWFFQGFVCPRWPGRTCTRGLGGASGGYWSWSQIWFWSWSLPRRSTCSTLGPPPFCSVWTGATQRAPSSGCCPFWGRKSRFSALTRSGTFGRFLSCCQPRFGRSALDGG